MERADDGESVAADSSNAGRVLGPDDLIAVPHQLVVAGGREQVAVPVEAVARANRYSRSNRERRA